MPWAAGLRHPEPSTQTSEPWFGAALQPLLSREKGSAVWVQTEVGRVGCLVHAGSSAHAVSAPRCAMLCCAVLLGGQPWCGAALLPLLSRVVGSI